MEVMVKIFKKNLQHLMSSQTLHLRTEEFSTLCTITAGMMNRRPLVQIGTSVDREVLTPAHFLLGGSPYVGMGPALAPGADLRARKAETNQLAGELWERLQKEYLNAQAKYNRKKGASEQKLGKTILNPPAKNIGGVDVVAPSFAFFWYLTIAFFWQGKNSAESRISLLLNSTVKPKRFPGWFINFSEHF